MRGFSTFSLILASGALFLAGCLGHAQLVRRDQAGGTLALVGHRPSAMEDAQAQMAGHCGGAYTITQEEMVVVGQQTQTGSQTNYGQSNYGNSSSGQVNSYGSSTTTNVTEYHVTYMCGAAAAAPQMVMTPQ